jgi:hypothetical protein
MVILTATSILEGQKEDKGMICSITHDLQPNNPVNQCDIQKFICSYRHFSTSVTGAHSIYPSMLRISLKD